MRHTIALLANLLFVLFSAAASGAASSPPIYLTANWPVPDTTPVTTLEQALLGTLNGASLSIDAALYDFSRPSLRDALLAAHERGVAVRIVTDDEAMVSNTSQAFYAALRAAGIPIVDDQDDGRLMHDKYAIIDGQVVWTGSTNWSENDIAENHNNAVVFTSTAAAEIYQRDFDQMFEGNFGSAKTPSPVTSLLYDGTPLEVYFSPQDGALQHVIAAVNAAQTSIDFAIFFFTDDDLRDALVAANARGVRVRGIFDALGATNASSDDEALCTAGVAIRIEQTPGKMHNKLMILDAEGSAPRVVTGSLNWTASGDERNAENIVIVHSQDTAETYAAAFAQWWAGSPARPGCEGKAAAYVYLPLIASPE